MTLRDFTANVISASKVVPDGNFKNSKASGVWDINEALDLIKGGNWPNAANIDPSAFVDALFQTHLYAGNGGTQTITNNVNLSGSGGLVWIKGRTGTPDNVLYDTERGANSLRLSSNTTNAAVTASGYDFTSFNSNGFTVKDGALYNYTNDSGRNFVSWTWRKQPKFFDVVQFTVGSAGTDTVINHSLGSDVGMVITKITSTTSNWGVHHRDLVSANEYMFLDTTAAATSYDTVSFSSTQVDLGTFWSTNYAGQTGIAYIFAHNNNDGGFGEPGDQDIIKCGSVTSDGSGNATVNLGFEPQWLMIKTSSSTTSGWHIIDNMRGVATGVNYQNLLANTNGAEVTAGANYFEFTSTGFNINAYPSATNTDWVYMAIRRGPLAAPTDATKVFDVTFNPTSPNVPSDTLVDTFLFKSTGSSQSWWVADRLRQGAGNLQTDTTANESSSTYLDFRFDQMTGTRTVANSFGSNYVGYTWKRAPSFFDVCCYVGNDTTGRTVSHNLGVVPEMIWTKRRNSTGGDWDVYHKDIGNTKYLTLNSSAAASTSQYTWNNTTPTASVFTIATGANNTNGDNFIAYLFATVAGVSKLGSFTHTSGSTNVDCGFTNGARFVLIKRTNTTGSWLTFDTVRGINASANDPVLYLDSNAAQDSGYDLLEPLSSGFTVSGNDWGAGGDFIFYAIA